MSKLEDQIKVVAKLREELDDAKDKRAFSFREWEHANKELVDGLTDKQETTTEAEDTLRELTLEAYAQDPTNKAPAPGVSVKIFQVLSYEQAEAMKWASEHRVALKLDVSIFEKIVKVDKPDFVTINDEPRAQIAKELRNA